MRHVGDRMIIAPPLVITPAEIDVLIERARKSLDECLAGLQKDGLMRRAEAACTGGRRCQGDGAG
jgi:putrescine aminotransferase